MKYTNFSTGQKKYTQAELEIINKWGVPSDKEFDTKRKAITGTDGIRVSSLMLAMKRKQIFEKEGLNSLPNRENLQ